VPDAAELALLRLARRAENDHALLQGGWPAAVQVAATPADPDNAILTYAFATAFPPIDDAALRRIALAVRLAADVVRLPPTAALAAQLEQHAILADLFPGDARIWTAVRAIAARAAWARTEEERYRSGARDVADLDDADAAAHARAAAVLPRFAAAVLALFTGADDVRMRLDAAIDAVADAAARIDAVVAWRADVAQNRATFVTARLARTDPDAYRDARAGILTPLAIPLYADGIATGVIDTALAGLISVRETLPAPVIAGWRMPSALLAQATRLRGLLDEAAPTRARAGRGVG